jgi:hypothetical protein
MLTPEQMQSYNPNNVTVDGYVMVGVIVEGPNDVEYLRGSEHPTQRAGDVWFDGAPDGWKMRLLWKSTSTNYTYWGLFLPWSEWERRRAK